MDEAPEYTKTLENLKHNIKARLFHMISEYNFLKMLCLKFLKQDQEVYNQSEKSVVDLRDAILLTKQVIQSGMKSTGLLERMSFDALLLQIFQEFAQYLVEDPIDLIKRGLNEEIQTALEKTDYYEYLVQILDYDLNQSLEIFEEMELPQIIRPYRELIQKVMKKI